MSPLATIFSLFLAATPILSAPHQAKSNAPSKAPCNQGSKSASNNTNNAVGAVFFITNEPTGNMVAVNAIANDGTLSMVGAVSTGGKGGHGVTDPNGPDALFTQGAVKVLGDKLFAVNAGSNTLSMLSIDMANPNVLSLVGKPVDTSGEFPVSVAVSKAVNQVCALNGGAKNGVACFKASSAGLSPVANTVRSLNVNQTTPPAGPAGTVSHVIFSEDGKQLIASVKGVPPTPGFLATWDVAADGSLSENFTSSTPATGGLLPFSMTAIPGTKAVLNTDAGVGFSVFNFGNLSSADGSASSTVVPISGQVATCWSSFSSKTGNLYLTDIGTATVTEVNVAKNLTGSIVNQYPQGNGTATIDNDIATVGPKDILYVLAANATTITVSSLDAPGKATALQKFDFSSSAAAMNITVNPNNVQGMTSFIAASATANNGTGTAAAKKEKKGGKKGGKKGKKNGQGSQQAGANAKNVATTNGNTLSSAVVGSQNEGNVADLIDQINSLLD